MLELNLRLVVEVGVIAILAATLGYALLSQVKSHGTSGGSVFRADASGTVFLFDGEALLDATPDARRLLSVTQPGQTRGGPWQRLMAYLSPRFPGCEEQLRNLPGEGSILTHSACGEALMLSAEFSGGLTRIVLSDASGAAGDPLAQRAQNAELAQLRGVLSAAPYMAWRQNAAGDVVWANAAYVAAAMHDLPPGGEIAWPMPRLFPATDAGRTRLDRTDGTAWFDISRFDDAGEDRLAFALPIDGMVQAELALREFRQTLTRTFADLPIGLAIFDRQRQLALFNPALIDLSGLQPDFLSRRPTLFAVLDAMRDRSMIPEPKDYRGWRARIADLEKAASTGGYEETWSLPSGQTYRVIGRPHPNGALALMFEDISTEMTRTRRYRADLELGQSVIDAVDEAIVVFAQGGALVMSNAAYADLWGHDPAGSLNDEGIATLCARWRDLSAPTPLWTEAEQFVVTLGPREARSDNVRLADGRLLECRFTPLPGGTTLIGFRAAKTGTPVLMAG